MQSYVDVVNERYNNREKNMNIYNNKYSLINSVGFYGTEKIRYALYKIFNILRNKGFNISEKNILDIGCGCGEWTRFFADLKGKSEGVYGMDLSNYRIEKAREFNQNIKYFIGDITTLEVKGVKFDIITAMDVFLHLNTKEQINSSLTRIHNSLNDKGIFLWYDVCCKDHFKAPENVEANGYSKKQMIKFADNCGFNKIFYSPIFKKLFWKVHSLYITERKIPFWIISLLEKILPGSPGNLIIMFQKR